MTRLARLAVLIGLASLVAGCGGSRQATTTSLPGLTATKLARLEATVRSEVRVSRDAHPSSVVIFATRLRQADAAEPELDVKGHGDMPVYFVVARGHFSCYGCSPQSGSGPTSGEFLTFVMGRKTLRPRCCGGISGHVDTTNLGPGLPLAGYSGARQGPGSRVTG